MARTTTDASYDGQNNYKRREESLGVPEAGVRRQRPAHSILPTTSPYGRDGQYLDVGHVSESHRSGRVVLDDWHRRGRGGLFESFEQSRPLDVDAVLARVARFDYAVALGIETDYFEDDDIG